jgi:hypothetical protein
MCPGVLTVKIRALAVAAVVSLAIAEPALAQVVVTAAPMSAVQAAGRWASNLVSALGVVWMLRMTVSGVRRRRTEWSRRDWIRFSYQLGLASVVVLAALAMAAMVDRGLYDVLPKRYHDWYFGLLLTLSLTGAGSLGHVLHRFAKAP